jgi:hypothetical protein
LTAARSSLVALAVVVVACTGGSGSTIPQITCPTGEVACGQQCVDVTADPGNCGGCGIPCSTGQICQAGACQCVSGVLCNGACIAPGATDCGTAGSTPTLVTSAPGAYWKTDGARRLPYLDGIRLEIQQNRELELLRFRRGQVHLISSLAPDQFQQLAAEDGTAVKDAGPTLESEMLWFNMNPAAPIEPYRKLWFASRDFRLAVRRHRRGVWCETPADVPGRAPRARPG